jgi:hypothetical protein
MSPRRAPSIQTISCAVLVRASIAILRGEKGEHETPEPASHRRLPMRHAGCTIGVRGIGIYR